MNKTCPNAPRKTKLSSYSRPKKVDMRYQWSMKGLVMNPERLKDLFERYELNLKKVSDSYYTYENEDTTLRVVLIQDLNEIKKNEIYYIGMDCMNEYTLTTFVYQIREKRESVRKEVNDRSLI